jgi:molecular chaperone GrpE (heat shock protein)
LIRALVGREGAVAAEKPGAAEAAWRARVAGLEMDLREREERMAAMQKEYSALEAQARAAAQAGGEQQLEQLLRRLVSPLAGLATLAALAEAGRPVEPKDLAAAFRSLEKQLHGAGLEQVGAVGERTAFDTALHQRLSGGAVSAGTRVTVRMPGYRWGQKVLLKAMVTAREVADE